MSTAVQPFVSAGKLLSPFLELGYRVILIDPMHYGPEPTGVETVVSLEHTVDALIDLHTEPIVENILVCVRNIDVFAGSSVHTLLSGLMLFGRRLGIVLIVDNGL